MPGGGTAVVHPDGRRWVVDKDNHVRAFARPGLQAKFNADGRLNTVQVARPNNNMLIARSVRGERATAGFRPGGVLVVTYGKNRGFVQRPYQGHAGYVQRTYLAGGRPYAHVYRVNRYRGIVYVRYVPTYYYQPQFYGWVSSPWRSQVAYNWGSAPWLGFYQGFFTPAPAYPSAALWLTDYVLSDDLQVAYQNHQEYEPTQEGAPASPEGSPETAILTPELKDTISQEVEQQVADEQDASTQTAVQTPTAADQIPPPALSPTLRTFVVSDNLDVEQAGVPCTLTPGDVIYRAGDNLIDGNKVGVNVLASKAGDCTANTPTEIDFTLLQEMYNRFREQIDAGLSRLASSQGQGGLPPAPAAGARPNPEGVAQPDADVTATLAQQQNDADSAEGAVADGVNAIGPS